MQQHEAQHLIRLRENSTFVPFRRLLQGWKCDERTAARKCILVLANFEFLRTQRSKITRRVPVIQHTEREIKSHSTG